MIDNLQRRIDRMARRIELLAGRLIVVEVHEGQERDEGLLDATLTSAGITRADQDVVVKLRRLAPAAEVPPCAILAVHPLTCANIRSAS